LPPLSQEDREALASFHQRQQVLRDITVGCITGHHTGAYIYGPPGRGKTHAIHNELRERRANWQLHQRITAKPLYHELEKYPGSTHIIDDCEQLFSERSALSMLRAALGGETIKGRRERRISYSISGSRARELHHYFYGSLIFTANRPLAEERPEVRAVMSRIPCLLFAPPDRELKAVMRDVARHGHNSERGQISAPECVDIIEHVINLAAELQCELDLRWAIHAFNYYLVHVDGEGSTDWRDALRFHMINSVTFFEHNRSSVPEATTQSNVGREETIKREVEIARQIDSAAGLSADEKVRRWVQSTGRSRPTYFRRLREGRE
jgi:hypothetical protein